MNTQEFVYYGFHSRIFQRFRPANVILKFVNTKEVWLWFDVTEIMQPCRDPGE